MSMGLPMPSSTRPNSEGPTGTRCGRPVGMTSVVDDTPCMSPMGVSRAASLTKPTTSAFSSKSSPGLRKRQISPTRTAGTTARMMVPMTWLTRPLTASGLVSASAERRAVGM